MPRGDGTGPMGMGAMTGRGMGYCAGFVNPAMGFGCGMGRGRGFRRMFCMTGLPGWMRSGTYPYEDIENEAPIANEKKALQNQAVFLEKQLSQVRKRLNSLEEAE